ncbi:MAG: ABC transporter substrate-binding protein, partial [Dehalococcoidia bacterium]
MAAKRSHGIEPTNRHTRRRVLRAGGAAAVASTALPRVGTRAARQDQQISSDFWNWWGVDRAPLMEEIIAEFEQQYPTITVESIVQPWDRREEQVITALSGGEPPEVVMATRQEIVQFANDGVIVPITQYVD